MASRRAGRPTRTRRARSRWSPRRGGSGCGAGWRVRWRQPRSRGRGRGGGAARRGVGRGTGWLAGQVIAMAPRLRVRDQAALRAQFPGLSPEELADALIEGAGRASAAVGGAVGAWAVLPVLPAIPAEVATETLAVVGIEIKLVAELHEAYGVPAPGGAVERMTAYVSAWAHRRGVFLAPGGIVIAAGSPVARLLRRRLAGRGARTEIQNTAPPQRDAVPRRQCSPLSAPLCDKQRGM